MSIHPYLMFDRNCREAFTRYQEIFGGELVLMPMSDMPAGDQPVAPEMADLIMHAALTWGDNLLMASDDPTGHNGVQGMQVNFATKDLGEAKRIFDALAEGGQVTMPLSETFWSPGFGMCVDRFGIPWMVSTEAPQQS